MNSPTRKFSFQAVLELIGINPFVYVPEKILSAIFKTAGKDKGPIPVKGTVNDKRFIQTLVKYDGMWRLYINTGMLPNSPKRIGEKIHITLQFDNAERTIKIHPDLEFALRNNSQASAVFNKLPASRRKEIIKYIAALKTEESREKNIAKAIAFLLGKSSFIGREKP